MSRCITNARDARSSPNASVAISRSRARRCRSTPRSCASQTCQHVGGCARGRLAAVPGHAALTGISATTIAPAPKLAWTWEGGEAFDSSPAIVDGVVYVGTATGELIALGLADGKLRWSYKAGEAIGESSPAVAGGRVYIGDLIGVVHAVSPPTASRSWTFKTQSEIKSSPVVVGDLVLMGSYDGKLYGLDAATASSAGPTRPRTTCTARRASSTASRISPAATRSSTPSTSRPARSAFATSATAYTGASVALVDNVAYFGTFDNQVIALDLGVAQGAVALRASRSQVSVLLVAPR